MFMEDVLELIKKIKKGDDKSFEILLERNRKLIYKIIYNRNLEMGDYLVDAENLFQEGSLALYDAVYSFEPERGMSFTSYAYMVIRSHINTYYRDNVANHGDEYYSIDNYENIDYHISMSNLQISDNPVEYHRELEFEKKLDEFMSKLCFEDRQLIEMRSDNYSYKQISERLNINTKRVDNRLRILRKRLKEHLKEE